MFRKGLLQIFYYYTVLAVTAVFFLFVSTFSNLFDGQTSWRSPWYDENNKAEGILWGGLLLYQLAALFAIIVFKRKHAKVSLWAFALLSFLFFMLFIAPSLFLFIAELSLMSNT